MNFDKIIKEKLEAFEGPFDPQAWPMLQSKLAAKPVSFEVPLMSGIAASVVLGMLMVTMPNKGSQTYESSFEPYKIESSKTAFTNESLEVIFEPQEVHLISLNNIQPEPVTSPKSNLGSSPNNDDIVQVEHTSARNEDSNSSTQAAGDTKPMDFVAKGIQCVGTEIQFSARLTEEANVVWLFESVHVKDGLSVKHIFDTPGEHKVRMVVTFKNGYEQSLTKSITVFETPKSDFKIEFDDNLLCYKNESRLIGTPKDNTYKWLLNGDTVGIGDELSLRINPGVHNIGVLTINEDRCASFDMKSIKVEQGLGLYAPTAFNASDANGRNDEWTITGLSDLESYKLDIVRLSTNQIVYTSTENASWNGSILGTAERPLKGEAFLWILKGKDKCGNLFEIKSDKPFIYL